MIDSDEEEGPVYLGRDEKKAGNMVVRVKTKKLWRFATFPNQLPEGPYRFLSLGELNL
jgi:hypothetical protein